MSDETQDERRGWTSASNAHADLLCPGRYQAQRGLPEETSEDAESGTRGHALVAGEESPEATYEERDMADRVKDIRSKILQQWVLGRKVVKTLVEKRLWIQVLGYHHSGKPDFLTFATDPQGGMHALVLDYKFGHIPVDDPDVNEQLRDQAVLADAAAKFQLASVTVQLIQPWAGKYTPAVYDRAALDEAKSRTADRVVASHATGARRVAGVVQCKYCRAKLRCPEFKALVTQPLPPHETREEMQQALDRVESILPEITDDKLARMLDVLGLAEKWLVAIKTEAKARLRERPGCIQGWVLTPGVVRSAITDVRTVWSRWAAQYPQATEALVAAMKISKTDLEKALRGVSGMKGGALKETMNRLLDGAVTQSTTSPQLKRFGEEGGDE
jgi:hypothetical protein